MIEINPQLRWSDLEENDRAIIQGWSLHLVGLLKRLHGQLQRVKEVVVEASTIEKQNQFLSRDDLLRIAEHHSHAGEPNRANAFRLAAALRTPAPSNDPA
jgi:precorrin-6B methylase 2